MADAATEMLGKIFNAGETEIINCPVSRDGTWLKRGYSFQNSRVGFISIDKRKVFDAEALTQ